jgi:hypothetical protein
VLSRFRFALIEPGFHFMESGKANCAGQNEISGKVL